MRASFLSDFYLLRSSMKSILSVFIFIMVFGMVQHSTYLLFFYPAFYSVFLPFSLFSMSEQTGWEWTLIAAPISRRGIVAGRYLFCQIFTLLMLLIGLICSLVIQAGSQIFFSALLSLSITLLIHAIGAAAWGPSCGSRNCGKASSYGQWLYQSPSPALL